MRHVKTGLLAALFALLLPGMALAWSQVWATGTSNYNPEKAWSGYQVLAYGADFAYVFDMNGNLVHEWDLQGGRGMPNKIYPGGHLLSVIYPAFNQAGQGGNTVAVLDFDGNIVRSFNRYYKVENPTDDLPRDANGEVWISRQHHDYQIEGNTVGYYYPGGDNVDVVNGDMLILGHRNTVNNDVTPGNYKLQDDAIYIIDKDGNVTWEWFAADHMWEFEMFSPENRAQIALRATISNQRQEANGFDWWHINCASWLGENKWYDEDPIKYSMFHPRNIICDSRNSSVMFIIDHVTGEIVWKVRPDHPTVGPIYGIHSTHMIPKGLPGEGNIMLYDNGGDNTYFISLGAQNFSEVIEFNPVTFEVVWRWPDNNVKNQNGWSSGANHHFFSYFISNCQRLPNGNTMIHEGNASRAIEVTPEGEIVWDFTSPFNNWMNSGGEAAYVYRSYRVPYDWIPQLPKPTEVPVYPIKPEQLQLPDANGNFPNITPTLNSRLRDNLAPQVEVTVPTGGYALPHAP